MTRKYFGTDGIRARVGQESMTPEFVLKLGWAVGKVLANGHQSLVLIGKDTRISGYMLESSLQAGLSAAGVDIRLVGPMPTPAIAYLTRTLRASAGIVISASHNPYYDNGLKFFSGDGLKLPDSVEMEIEKRMEEPLEVVSSDKLGKAERITDATGRYIEFCKSTIPTADALHGLQQRPAGLPGTGRRRHHHRRIAQRPQYQPRLRRHRSATAVRRRAQQQG